METQITIQNDFALCKMRFVAEGSFKRYSCRDMRALVGLNVLGLRWAVREIFQGVGGND